MPIKPYLTINGDKTFSFYYVPKSTDPINGTWEYITEKNSITFNFLNYDKQWIQILKEDLSIYGGDIIRSEGRYPVKYSRM